MPPMKGKGNKNKSRGAAEDSDVEDDDNNVVGTLVKDTSTKESGNGSGDDNASASSSISSKGKLTNNDDDKSQDLEDDATPGVYQVSMTERLLKETEAAISNVVSTLNSDKLDEAYEYCAELDSFNKILNNSKGTLNMTTFNKLRASINDFKKRFDLWLPPNELTSKVTSKTNAHTKANQALVSDYSNTSSRIIPQGVVVEHHLKPLPDNTESSVRSFLSCTLNAKDLQEGKPLYDCAVELINSFYSSPPTEQRRAIIKLFEEIKETFKCLGEVNKDSSLDSMLTMNSNDRSPNSALSNRTGQTSFLYPPTGKSDTYRTPDSLPALTKSLEEGIEQLRASLDTYLPLFNDGSPVNVPREINNSGNSVAVTHTLTKADHEKLTHRFVMQQLAFQCVATILSQHKFADGNIDSMLLDMKSYFSPSNGTIQSHMTQTREKGFPAVGIPMSAERILHNTLFLGIEAFDELCQRLRFILTPFMDPTLWAQIGDFNHLYRIQPGQTYIQFINLLSDGAFMMRNLALPKGRSWDDYGYNVSEDGSNQSFEENRVVMLGMLALEAAVHPGPGKTPLEKALLGKCRPSNFVREHREQLNEWKTLEAQKLKDREDLLRNGEEPEDHPNVLPSPIPPLNFKAWLLTTFKEEVGDHTKVASISLHPSTCKAYQAKFDTMVGKVGTVHAMVANQHKRISVPTSASPKSPSTGPQTKRIKSDKPAFGSTSSSTSSNLKTAHTDRYLSTLRSAIEFYDQTKDQKPSDSDFVLGLINKLNYVPATRLFQSESGGNITLPLVLKQASDHPWVRSSDSYNPDLRQTYPEVSPYFMALREALGFIKIVPASYESTRNKLSTDEEDKLKRLNDRVRKAPWGANIKKAADAYREQRQNSSGSNHGNHKRSKSDN